MPSTYCIGPFSKRIGVVELTADAYRAVLAEIPATCERKDCTPGGCKKHCTDYARGAWVRGCAKERK